MGFEFWIEICEEQTTLKIKGFFAAMKICQDLLGQNRIPIG